jgi:hypothetical protein
MEPLAAPQHYVPPGARELRAQAVQRLQAGLFGIAAIILVVGLASIINQRAREADLAGKPLSAPSASQSPAAGADPLAEVGVMPSSAPDTAAAVVPSPSVAAKPAVPGPAN